MFPDCKWIIVGGSPCQDLTFAGPLRGVLGLVGPSSRLFFVLLCVIYAMQRLVGAEAVRYLVENAASMLQIHLDAFCRLLGLPLDQQGRYVWDPWDFGFQIARRRNYFRNFDDTEEIGSPTQVFDHNYGPLVDQSGNNVPFAPLLRTRESLPYGMLRSSWTLYQAHALVWDYAYWNGRVSFGKACKLGANKLPHLRWEQVIPPPFLKAWFKFLQVCESRCVRGKDMDAILSPLLPLFHCKCYSIPFCILTEEEVSALSGLHGIWTRISPEDAEALPERLVRDYCGNCFHPALILSALGNNETLKRWVAEDGGPNVLVADQSEAFHVFARLCDQVDAEAKHKVKNEKVVIDRTLPPFQTLEPCGAQQTASHVVSEKPDVLPPSMAGYRKVRVTKAEKHIQQCIDAALHKLEEHQCLALRTCGLERIFDGLRATSLRALCRSSSKITPLVLLGKTQRDWGILLFASRCNAPAFNRLRLSVQPFRYGMHTQPYARWCLSWSQAVGWKRAHPGLSGTSCSSLDEPPALYVTLVMQRPNCFCWLMQLDRRRQKSMLLLLPVSCRGRMCSCDQTRNLVLSSVMGKEFWM